MKKLIFTLLALVMCASLAACGGNEPGESTTTAGTTTVTTTTTTTTTATTTTKTPETSKVPEVTTEKKPEASKVPEVTTEKKPVTEPTPTVCAHDYQVTATKDATCTAKGSKTYTCSKCSDSYSEEIAMIAHDYADATCTAPKTCKACGNTDGKAAGHDHKVTATKDATCTAKGSKTYTCSKCNDSYSEEIKMIAHDYKDATCTAPKTCKACGKTEGKAAGHNYVNDVCSRCGGIRPLYSGYTFLNCLDFFNDFVPLNPDGSINYQLIFDECCWMEFSESEYIEYDDEDYYVAYTVVPEHAFIEAVRKRFVLSDAQVQELINASPYSPDYIDEEPSDWEDDWCSYYKDGYFYIIENGGMGGFQPGCSPAIVGYTSRPGELVIYVEYAQIIYAGYPNVEFDDAIGYEPLFYYAVTYEYTGSATDWVVYADHNCGSVIASYDRAASDSLRVKSVEVIDAVPSDAAPVIGGTKISTHYDYEYYNETTDDYGWMSFTIYEDNPSVIADIGVDGIDCCTEFHKDGETITCDCGKIVFTNENLFGVSSRYTFNREFE